MRLSNSSIDTFKMCPRMYKLKYLDKIRPDFTTSALHFGSAFDTALSTLLLRKKKVLVGKEKVNVKQDPKKVFDSAFTIVKINRSMYLAPKCVKLVYSNRDFDEFIITREDYKAFEQLDLPNMKDLEGPADYIDFMYEFQQLRREGAKFIKDEIELYNLMNWRSLRRKGHLMLEAYEKDIYPIIDEVFELQKKVSLVNEEGDEITGFIDVDAAVNGIRRVIDNKSTSIKFKDDSVITSQQLAIYGESEENLNCAYAPVNKNIKKIKHKKCVKCGFKTTSRHATCNNKLEDGSRCSGVWDIRTELKAETQFITGTIDSEFKEELFEEIREIATDIKNEEFECNLDSCKMQYGSKCVYFNLCHNASMEGLVCLSASR